MQNKRIRLLAGALALLLGGAVARYHYLRGSTGRSVVYGGSIAASPVPGFTSRTMTHPRGSTEAAMAACVRGAPTSFSKFGRLLLEELVLRRSRPCWPGRTQRRPRSAGGSNYDAWRRRSGSRARRPSGSRPRHDGAELSGHVRRLVARGWSHTLARTFLLVDREAVSHIAVPVACVSAIRASMR